MYLSINAYLPFTEQVVELDLYYLPMQENMKKLTILVNPSIISQLLEPQSVFFSSLATKLDESSKYEELDCLLGYPKNSLQLIRSINIVRYKIVEMHRIFLSFVKITSDLDVHNV